ncbi:MAG TPA: ABC transporter ATP-binding protein [Chitinophagales bacterium]|nr:ABC transporter ATP-binding protein [Chitinophagales bacterium]
MINSQEETAISVRHLTKKFKPKYAYAYPGLKGRKNGHNGFEGEMPGISSLLAVNDVSFDVKRGESVGIIGKNGSGKSTLLRMLSGIIQPTGGEIRINGAVTSILDIGTGFHPDLTGRENFNLIADLYSVPDSRVKEIYQQVETFSEISQFMDVPVKYYSNGMFLRLAFSVSAHINSDIILIDEVLSVGDANFKIRSFQKIRDLINEGKTVIIVSHDIGSINELCDSVLIMDHGKMLGYGNRNDMVDSYIETIVSETRAYYVGSESEGKTEELQPPTVVEEKKPEESEIPLVEEPFAAEEELQSVEPQEEQPAEPVGVKKEEIPVEKVLSLVIHEKKPEPEKTLLESTLHLSKYSWRREHEGHKNDKIELDGIIISSWKNDKEDRKDCIYTDEPIEVTIEYEKRTADYVRLAVVFNQLLNVPVFFTSPVRAAKKIEGAGSEPPGKYTARCMVPRDFLNAGIYTLDVFFTDEKGKRVALYAKIISFRIELPVSYKDLADPQNYIGNFPGALIPLMEWKVKKSQ